VTKLEQGLAEAEAMAAGARELLAQPELFGISPDDVVEVGPASEAAKSARATAEAAFSTLQAVTAQHRELTRLAGRMSKALAGLAPLEEEYAELRALSEVVNGRGQNARKMSLRSYVLAARLEEVALAATARLRTMSQGRYSFVHSDAAGARGTRGGLGLDVLDDYSGAIRPAKTLSGGESFLASLSLALGLADVVAAETGGALLDTLFVDEGFGTLDAETLDVVMNILDELRAGGRVVGLVSHVEELRQRIPTRLRVRKARTGSKVEVRTA
jgi:exonuclease SbcC